MNSPAIEDHDSGCLKWLALLRCVECGAKLQQRKRDLVCEECGAVYHYSGPRPVLLREDNPLFPSGEYRDLKPDGGQKRKSKVRDTLKRLIPSRSVNLARKNVYQKIGESLPTNSRVLVIGCGQQRGTLDLLCRTAAVQFLLTDIDHQADCDIFCDAQELPFADESFDGVVTTAVIEHVMKPWVVAEEITRVVKEGGFVYSEAPFLLGVHEGAYDFTRFTLGGHRALFRRFREVEAGAVAGPGTSLVWAATGVAESVFLQRRLAQLANATIRVAIGWIKHIDRWIAKRPRAEDFASCTYFWGTKTPEEVSAAEIVSRYRGRRFTHSLPQE